MINALYIRLNTYSSNNCLDTINRWFVFLEMRKLKIKNNLPISCKKIKNNFSQFIQIYAESSKNNQSAGSAFECGFRLGVRTQVRSMKCRRINSK